MVDGDDRPLGSRGRPSDSAASSRRRWLMLLPLGATLCATLVILGVVTLKAHATTASRVAGLRARRKRALNTALTSGSLTSVIDEEMCIDIEILVTECVTDDADIGEGYVFLDDRLEASHLRCSTPL